MSSKDNLEFVTTGSNNRPWIFMDAGDTFIYGYPTFYEAIQECFKEEGVEITNESVKYELIKFLKANSRDHIVSQELFQEYYLTLYRTVLEGLSFPGNMDQYVNFLWDEWTAGHRLRLFGDACEALQLLHHSGYPMGIISNWDNTLHNLLKRLRVDNFFRVKAVSCAVGMAKPDRKIFQYALSQAGIGPEKAWYLGDQLDVDIEPAKSLGMKTILVDYYGKEDNEGQADFIASNMLEAAGIIINNSG